MYYLFNSANLPHKEQCDWISFLTNSGLAWQHKQATKQNCHHIFYLNIAEP